MFLAILGCEAGFMGLRLLATGGVYICGGIGPKVGGFITACSVLAVTSGHADCLLISPRLLVTHEKPMVMLAMHPRDSLIRRIWPLKLAPSQTMCSCYCACCRSC